MLIFCILRWIVSHWTTREVPGALIFSPLEDGGLGQLRRGTGEPQLGSGLDAVAGIPEHSSCCLAGRESQEDTASELEGTMGMTSLDSRSVCSLLGLLLLSTGKHILLAGNWSFLLWSQNPLLVSPGLSLGP